MISITVGYCVDVFNTVITLNLCVRVGEWMMGRMYILLLVSYHHKTVQYLTNGHTYREKIHEGCSHISSSIT